MTIVDAAGREHPAGETPLRIVSLVPSVTESLFDLGVGSSVVGVTDFCIFPEGMPKTIAKVGGTKSPSIDLIRSLAPDLVHVNFEENLEKHGSAISAFARLFVSEPKTVDDVARLLANLGELHDCRAEASAWIERLRIESLLSSPWNHFSFACPIWRDPWMWCGADTYVSSLVESAGGRNVLSDHRRYPRLPLDEVIGLAPDLIFLPDEPYAFSLDDRRKLESLRSGVRIIGPFPGHLLTWHGTRTLLGLRYLRETLGAAV